MNDWKESKRIHDEARRVERDAAELSQRLGIPDPLTAWKRDADARAEEKRQADRERRAEERRDRRERVESAAVTQLRGEIEALHNAISEGDANVLNIVNEAVFPMFDKIATKLQELETLLERLRSLRSTAEREPIDLPRVPLRSVRNIN
jgi:hypothetical protein